MVGNRTKDRGLCFFRYVMNSKACRVLVHISKHPYIHDNMAIESDNVELFEHIYPSKSRYEESSAGSKRPQDELK